MSEYCEISEALAVAESSCPVTDIVMVTESFALSTSELIVELEPRDMLIDSVVAQSFVHGVGYAILYSNGTAYSSALHDQELYELAEDNATARSRLVAGFNESVVDTALAEGIVLVSDASHLLVSSATASSALNASTEVYKTLISSAVAKSFVLTGQLEICLSEALATDAVFTQRVVDVLATSEGYCASEAYPSDLVDEDLLLSRGFGASYVFTQVETNALVVCSGVATSEVFFSNPSYVAWVMNTETSAMSLYDNFGFDSIISFDGRQLAVTSEGIFELTGDTDHGMLIDARIKSGFDGFRTSRIKRIDNIYFGYTSDGMLDVNVEVYDSKYPMCVYRLEERDASAPRTSRVTPGKGLWGRYWRLEVTNVGGSDFVVHDMEVDIAEATRRI